MASNTRTLAQSVEWASFFLSRRPFYGLDSNSTLEPALTTGNVIIQTMLQPPFKWRWNRNSTTFNITTAGGDVVKAIPDFGFVEKYQIVPSAGPNSGKVYEVPYSQLLLSQDSDQGKISTIAAYLDDNAGNITFRTMPGKADVNSTVTVIYQKAPVLLTAVTGTGGTWPIPDSYGHVYDNGVLFYFLLYAGDSRAFAIGQKFASNLIALSEGLDEQAKAIFLGEWDVILQQAARGQSKMQLAQDGRTR